MLGSSSETQPRAKVRWAFTLALSLMPACVPGASDAVAVEQVRLQVDGEPGRELAVDDLPRQPQAGERVRISFTVPEVAVDDPALHIDPWVAAGEVLGVEVEDRALPRSGSSLGVYPLPPGASGRLAQVELTGPRGHRIDVLEVGSQSSLTQQALRELDELVVGLGLAFVGVALTVARVASIRPGAERTALNPLAHLGVFSAFAGVLTVAQCTGLRGLVSSSADVWRWGHAVSAFGYPAGLALFVDAVLPVARSALRRVAIGYGVGLAFAVAADLAGVVALEQTKRVAFAATIALVPWLVVRAARHASTSAAGRALLVGFPLAGIVAAPDIASGVQGGDRVLNLPQTTHWALLALASTLLIALARVWTAQASALLRSEAELAAQVVALDQRGAKLDALNAELSRQVVQRARAMSRAAQLSTSTSSREFEVGALVDERYRVDGVLGEGGMGQVLSVTRTDGEQFALKILRRGMDASAALRFIREAEIAASLRHPNLVSVVDVGVTTAGVLFLAMDRVDGGSLEDRRRGFGDEAGTIPRLAQISMGLAFLHANKVVHRDLKPANVLVGGTTDQEVMRISDFGIARSDSGDEAALADTHLDGASSPLETQGLIGTPLYMAPEGSRGPTHVGQQADVFAFGVMAYELAYGNYPFSSAPILETLAGRPAPRVLTPARIEARELWSLLSKCLDAEPSRRPTAEQLVSELQRMTDSGTGRDAHATSSSRAPPPS